MSGAIRITDALLGEHGALYAWLDAVEAILAEDPSPARIRDLTRTMAAVLGSHARVENELLLDEAARRGVEEGPLSVMRREHDDIESLIDEARSEVEAGLPERGADLLGEAIAVAREHFEKEELAAFPAAERALEEETLHHLGRRWAERRGVRLGDGSGA